ncbi:MAG: hypothetical protein E7614_07705 [Ruminococcaceae bacterium]|nr:hypothetical protein [Oscillospiraceae bacterium]
MSFKLKCSLANTTPSIEYAEGKKGETFLYGEALTLSEGKLTKCQGTTKPEFICLGDVICKDDETKVPAFRIMDFYLFTAPISEDASALKAGDKVTLSADALGVTATTASGVAEIVDTDTDKVTVKF